MKSLDVHGSIQSEAQVKINSFIKEGFITRQHAIVVIHGNGKQVLQKLTHKICTQNKYVDRFEYAPPQFGGTGATIIYMKKRGVNGKIIGV